MIETSTLISDIKGDFEGGSSLTVDWNTVIRRGVQNVTENCRPDTLKRLVPIYGGLAKDLFVYYCPPDVLVPADIYGNDGKRQFSYVPPKMFYTQQKSNVYTIEYINGARFIIIRHGISAESITIDEMDAIGLKTGGSPALNTQNFMSGVGAIEATFTDAGIEFGSNMTSVDITDYLRGIVLVPAYIPLVKNLVSIEVRLKTTDADYYKVITTQDDISNYLIDGWNQLRFSLANATSVGSPNPASIVEWSIIGKTATGTTLKIVFDRFTVQKFTPYFFEYYSDRAYVNGLTGEMWKETVETANNDKINFDKSVGGILHYECCMIVQQSATFTQRDPNATKGFSSQLGRKYQEYWATHPSNEAPLTYNKSPEIDMSSDVDAGRTQDTDF